MKKVRSIGGYIHRLRVDRGLTLKNVADHLEIDISSLSKIEHGERQLQSHMIRPIAKLFDIVDIPVKLTPYSGEADPLR